jgi:hypothetical protein
MQSFSPTRPEEAQRFRSQIHSNPPKAVCFPGEFGGLKSFTSSRISRESMGSEDTETTTKEKQVQENLPTSVDREEEKSNGGNQDGDVPLNEIRRTEIKNQVMKQDVRELIRKKFWEEANPIEYVLEVLFHIQRRDTTIQREVYCGLIQFISCLYILPVLPHQMENAGYDLKTTYVVTVCERSKSLLTVLGVDVWIWKHCWWAISKFAVDHCPSHFHLDLLVVISSGEWMASSCR